MKKSLLVLWSALILAPAALPAKPRVVVPMDERAPGIMRLADIADDDTVTVDGEQLNVAALERSGYEVLLAPGQYVVNVRHANGGRACTMRVNVVENQVAAPACARIAKVAQGR